MRAVRPQNVRSLQRSVASGDQFDLAVIGAGSAGFSAAITAAEGGQRVALIGHGTIGGTCVNVGCVPSKTMIRVAEAIHGPRAAQRFPGLSGTAQVDDWATLIAGKDDLVATLRQKKYADLLPGYDSISYIDRRTGPACGRRRRGRAEDNCYKDHHRHRREALGAGHPWHQGCANP